MNYKSLLLPVLVCFVCSSSFATKHNIAVAEFSFTPSSLTIPLGDTIVFNWVNGTHTATSTSVPAGAAPFDAPISSGSVILTYVPTKVGTYAYICTPHSSMGMTGSFSVTFPTSITQVNMPVFSLSPNPARNNVQVQLSDNQVPTRVSIINIIGKELYYGVYTGIASINVENLPNGVYFIKAETLSRSYIQKLIVSH